MPTRTRRMTPNGFNKKDEEKDKSKKLDTDNNGYQKFTLPWHFRFDFSVEYGDQEFNKRKLTYDQDITQSSISLEASTLLKTGR